MQFTDILQYVVAPTLGLLAVLSPIAYKIYQERKKAKQEAELEEISDKDLALAVSQITEINSILKETLAKIETINRIIIVRCTPSPINPDFLTVIYEEHDRSVPPIMGVVQNQPVDKFHREEVILPIIIKGKVMVNRETAGGYLKDIYEAFGHSFSKCFKIFSDETSMTYIVFSFSEGTLDSTPPLYREIMRGQVNRLTNIFTTK